MSTLYEEIAKAADRTKGQVLKTPLFYSTYLSALNDGEVYLKLENEQYTGSFKARGALNKVLKLSLEERSKGLVTASTGNHAQGFARALTIAGAKGTIYLPTNAEPSKVEALNYYDAQLEFHGDDPLTTELYAKEIAASTGQVWVSPYNDWDVIAGQGTIGVEIMEELNDVEAVFGCIGGGGMMSGVACWIKEVSPATKLIGCLPANSPEMYLSVKEDRVVMLDEYQPTLSDGSAGGLEEDSITFEICKQLIDTYELVEEAKIAERIKYMVDKHHKIVEGAAAVALSAFMDSAEQYKNQKVVIIICGANITTSKLKKII
ncbi:MAG: threonine/serine dehydratase [Cyclobacteriaceae bacterium]